MKPSTGYICNLSNYRVAKTVITVDKRGNINDDNVAYMGFGCSNTIITVKVKGGRFKMLVDIQHNGTNDHEISLLKMIREMFSTNKLTTTQYNRFMGTNKRIPNSNCL
eukprot:TRINITY_DN8753_c0_g1_i2.p1 TRINITY_DN8753_c0_g1~~TRINITY_DN8753_c0_g1_i2.p1  ORF type:complete len:108 (-),score=21.30 TRINITY_DN8753_c0_g1_i2:491-814(-)